MLLAIDVGNTEITVGLFSGDRLDTSWRLTTVANRTPDEWNAILSQHLVLAGHSPQEVRAVVYGSVAPGVTGPLVEGITKAVGAEPRAVGPESDLPLVLDVEEPLTVGADRVVNTLAASRIYQRDTIVVDFGTATTYDCITADGRFLGGVIAPGLVTAAEHLIMRTAKLPATELVPPGRVIGRRTEDCIRSGVLLGGAEATDGIVRRIKAEWPGAEVPYVVATGGLASTIAPLTTQIEAVDPDLTLRGLRIAAELLGLCWT
jgi:type III pantothenate kinase